MTSTGPRAPGGADEPLVYLDHAATSPLRPAAAEAMAPFLGPRYGNASGAHRVARDARRALEDAREEVAHHLGARPDEVVFTSGGTESANLAVLGSLGAALASARPPGALACSAVEHAAVLAPCAAAAGGTARAQGVPPLELRVVPVDAEGRVELGALDELLDPSVGLVSIMLANNEVGTVQPLPEAAAVVRRRAPGAVLHTDAVQAAPWLDVGGLAADADLVGISGHKVGGPQGIGALVVRTGVPLRPILHGGGQEQDRRSGTHNVAGAVGLAVALREAVAAARAEGPRVAALSRCLAQGLEAGVPGAVRSVPSAAVLPGHCHVRFPDVEQEELLVLLDDAGVCASAGAACSSGAVEPSHVLAAMGVPTEEAAAAVRFTLGHTTTDLEVHRALEVTVRLVGQLRSGGSGSWVRPR